MKPPSVSKYVANDVYPVFLILGRVQLLRVLETRKIVLQKEQGMAFARATAAGFTVENIAHLISFAECFGAVRML